MNEIRESILQHPAAPAHSGNFRSDLATMIAGFNEGNYRLSANYARLVLEYVLDQQLRRNLHCRLTKVDAAIDTLSENNVISAAQCSKLHQCRQNTNTAHHLTTKRQFDPDIYRDEQYDYMLAYFAAFLDEYPQQDLTPGLPDYEDTLLSGEFSWVNELKPLEISDAITRNDTSLLYLKFRDPDGNVTINPTIDRDPESMMALYTRSWIANQEYRFTANGKTYLDLKKLTRHYVGVISKARACDEKYNLMTAAEKDVENRRIFYIRDGRELTENYYLHQQVKEERLIPGVLQPYFGFCYIYRKNEPLYHWCHAREFSNEYSDGSGAYNWVRYTNDIPFSGIDLGEVFYELHALQGNAVDLPEIVTDFHTLTGYLREGVRYRVSSEAAKVIPNTAAGDYIAVNALGIFNERLDLLCRAPYRGCAGVLPRGTHRLLCDIEPLSLPAMLRPDIEYSLEGSFMPAGFSGAPIVKTDGHILSADKKTLLIPGFCTRMVGRGAQSTSVVTPLPLPSTVTDVLSRYVTKDIMLSMLPRDRECRYDGIAVKNTGGCLTSPDGAVLLYAPQSCIELPQTLKVIARGAFSAPEYGTIVLPAGVMRIEPAAICAPIDKLKALGKIENANESPAWFGPCGSVRFNYINAPVFDECITLREKDIRTGAGGVKYVDLDCEEFLRDYALELFGTTSADRSALKSIKIPEDITEIRRFTNCRVSQVIFPSTLRTIGAYAFSDHALQIIDLPQGLAEIGEGAFSTLSAKQPSALEFQRGWYLPDYRFDSGRNFPGAGIIGRVSIPSSVKRVGMHVFAWYAVDELRAPHWVKPTLSLFCSRSKEQEFSGKFVGTGYQKTMPADVSFPTGWCFDYYTASNACSFRSYIRDELDRLTPEEITAQVRRPAPDGMYHNGIERVKKPQSAPTASPAGKQNQQSPSLFGTLSGLFKKR